MRSDLNYKLAPIELFGQKCLTLDDLPAKMVVLCRKIVWLSLRSFEAVSTARGAVPLAPSIL